MTEPNTTAGRLAGRAVILTGAAGGIGRVYARRLARTKPVLTTTITSPPYWNLKDYGHPRQIGWGQPHDEYLVEMRRVFRTIFRHTRDDGSLWVVADTLREPLGPLYPLPFQLAQEAKDAGWQLRDVVVWRKDKTLPWSGKGRLRNAFEYILLLSKTDGFKYYVDRIRDPIRLEQWWVKWPERYNPQGKVPTNVWDIPIPVQGSWRNSAIEHMCPLPADLVERLVLLSTDPGDVVLDPFAGSGVVVAEAERLGRFGVGVEIVERSVKAFRSVTRPEVMKRNRDDALGKVQARSVWLQQVICNLRVVKYPRPLLQMLQKERPDLPRPRLVLAVLRRRGAVPAAGQQTIPVKLVCVVEGSASRLEAVRKTLEGAAKVPPSSKFGIASEIEVVSPADLERYLGRRRWYLYRNGRTWKRDGTITPANILRLLEEPAAGKWPPILSNVECNEDPRALDEDIEKSSDAAARAEHARAVTVNSSGSVQLTILNGHVETTVPVVGEVMPSPTR